MIPYQYALRRRMMMQDIVKLPPAGRGFANYTWAELDAISQAGLAAEYFTVGETRNISLSYTIEGVAYSGTYELAIHGINHDDLADGSGKAGLTVGFNTVLDGYHVLHPSNATGIYWGNSAMRTTYLPEYFAALPADLQAVIKTVDKIYEVEDSATVTENKRVVQDKMFLASDDEIRGGGLGVLFVPEGSQYEYFETAENRIKYDTSGTAQIYWSRTMAEGFDDNDRKIMKGMLVDIEGALAYVDCSVPTSTTYDSNLKSVTRYRYIAPLFCI